VIDEGDLFVNSVSFDDDSQLWDVVANYGDEDPEGNEVRFDDVTDMTFDLSHRYFKDGEYTVTVKVTDDEGAEDSSFATVVVNNVSPTIDSGPDDATISVFEDETYESTVSFTDPGDVSWTAMVGYGDGGGWQELPTLSETSFQLSHDYTCQGSGPFNVSVTVTDDDGADDSGTAQVVVNHEYDLTVDKAKVKLDRGHRCRSNREHVDVEGTIPLSVLDCFDPETDAVTVSFEGLTWEIGAYSFVPKDDKWQFKGPRRTAGVRKFDLHYDGRLKIHARYLNLALERGDFPGEVSFSISIGPASGDTGIQLDRPGRLHRRSARRSWWR
jgi:hypothetical protein